MIRKIGPHELQVLDRVLAVGAKGGISDDVLSSTRSLNITAECQCGCATIWFGPRGDAASGRIVAEAFGRADEEHVEVIVWIDEGILVGLEIVGGLQPPLPSIESIQAYPDP
jgi:hypothetical protein